MPALTTTQQLLPPLGLPLVTGTLVKRYKRFLADIRLPDVAEPLTVHCANSGSMKGLDEAGIPAIISDSENDARKLRYSLEFVQVDDGNGPTWVGVHTSRPNDHVAAALEMGALPGIPANTPYKREVKYGAEGRSRIDLLTHPDGERHTYVEVKNTTLAERHDGDVLEARFPDAVTVRGQKHLNELMHVIDQGHDAMIVFLVNRSDCERFAPADDIDPEYGVLLRQAIDYGVKVVPLVVEHDAEVRPDGQVSVSSMIGVPLDIRS